MSITLGLMTASAAYSAYNEYQASSAKQDALSQQIAFHQEYLVEMDRRQEMNEEMALGQIRNLQDQSIVTAAALGKDVGGDSAISNMEKIAALGTEQLLRDRQEYAWERQASIYKQESMVATLESEQSAQTTNLISSGMGGAMQFSQYYDSGLKKG